jgi:hypothetical protein
MALYGVGAPDRRKETLMSVWEYKTLVYSLEGKVVYSLRFWADSAGKAYGPRERSTLIGGIARQMRQLEDALKELDREGWELVSVSAWMAFPFTRHGCAVLRRPSAQA